jgi:outer membrane protein assembly factor BamB
MSLPALFAARPRLPSARKPRARSLATACGLALVAATVSALADGGHFLSQPHGGTNSTDRLPERLDEPAALLWKTPVDPGHSTPVVSSGKLFLTSFRESARELATEAFDAATGRPLWRRSSPVQRLEEFHRGSGGAAQPSPASDGERIFAVFGSYGLVCYDLDGRLLWERRFGPFQDEYGAGSSPVLVDGRLILQQDHDVDSFLMALDPKTGAVIWKTARPDAVRSYSTPTSWLHDGKRELLVAGALELSGYDPANGERLWSMPGLARIVIPAPLAAGNRIYMASWAPGGDAGRRLTLPTWADAQERWDADKNQRLARSEVKDAEVLDRFFRMDLDQSGDLTEAEWNRHAAVFLKAQNAVLAIQPTSTRGELSAGDVVWKHARGVPYVATPILADGALWMVKDGGIVTKLATTDGHVEFEERLPGVGNYHASPAAGDGKVYFASDPGVVCVVASQGPWRVVSSLDLKERIRASPVLHAGRLYIRTDQALRCFGSKP